MMKLEIYTNPKHENFKKISKIMEELKAYDSVNYSIERFGYSLSYDFTIVDNKTNEEIKAKMSKLMDLADNFNLF